MEPVSNTDRLVLLLRRKLEERAKSAGASRSSARSGQGVVTGRSAVRALAAAKGVDERQVRRAVIQSILADQLGPELMNDAKFQQIVSRVNDAITEDQRASSLLSRLIQDLREGR